MVLLQSVFELLEIIWEIQTFVLSNLNESTQIFEIQKSTSSIGHATFGKTINWYVE